MWPGAQQQAGVVAERERALDALVRAQVRTEVVARDRGQRLADVVRIEEVAESDDVGQRLAEQLVRQAAGPDLVALGIDVGQALDVVVVLEEPGVHRARSRAATSR